MTPYQAVLGNTAEPNDSVSPRDLNQEIRLLKAAVGGGGSSVGGGALGIAKNVPPSGSGALIAGNYARTKTKLAAVKAGTASMKFGVVGDSTTVGAGSRSGGTNAVMYTNARSKASIVYMTNAINSKGLPAACDNWFGDANSLASAISFGTYDVRITDTAGTAAIAAKALGGNIITNTTNTNGAVFTPTRPTDTCDYYYRQGVGYGSYNMGGPGFTQVVSGEGVDALIKATFTRPLATVDQRWIAGKFDNTGVLNFCGMDAYDSNVKSVRCYQLGWGGSQSSDWIKTDTTYAYLNGLLALGLDTVLIRAGTNDCGNAVSLATYQANLTALVTALLPTTDVILSTHYPFAVSVKTLQVQKTYVDVIYAVAAQFGLLVQDTYNKVISYEQANQLGYYSDTLHPNAAIYQLSGEADATLLLSLA